MIAVTSRVDVKDEFEDKVDRSGAAYPDVCRNASTNVTESIGPVSVDAYPSISLACPNPTRGRPQGYGLIAPEHHIVGRRSFNILGSGIESTTIVNLVIQFTPLHMTLQNINQHSRHSPVSLPARRIEQPILILKRQKTTLQKTGGTSLPMCHFALV